MLNSPILAMTTKGEASMKRTNDGAKNALVFASSGAIAAGVARALASTGFCVHLSAKRGEAAETLAADINKNGSQAYSYKVDALDQSAVRAHVEKIDRDFGGVQTVFNGIGGRPVDLGYPARSTVTSVDDFLIPLSHIVGSQFLTAREAARVMQPRKNGSIVFLSATLSGGAFSYMAGIAAACSAVESVTRTIAAEVGPHGIRVNCVRGSAMPETRTIQETGAGQAALTGEPMSLVPPLMKRPITVSETAKVAAFLASDQSSGMTGQVLTVCAGQFFFN
jgi:3-oxoacyl-[acyl-carrier protein] reductase